MKNYSLSFGFTSAYPMIASFGGAFLLMVFLAFALDEERHTRWLGALKIGAGLIGASLWSSVLHRRMQTVKEAI